MNNSIILSKNELEAIFNEIQGCNASTRTKHRKLLINSINENNEMSTMLLNDIFPKMLGIKNKDVPSSIIEFLRHVYEELDKNNETFIEETLNLLMEYLESKNKKSRRTAMLLIRIIIESVKPGIIRIDDNLILKISEKLFDKESGVRREALRMLRPYQSYMLGGKTMIQNIFKDMSRFDSSTEIRKEAMKVMDINANTQNALAERSADINTGIRKLFYIQILPHLCIKELSENKRKFLFRKAFSEREFDAKISYIEKCLIDYDVNTELINLVSDHLDHSDYSFLIELLKRIFELTNIEIIIDDAFFENLSPASSFLARTYFELKNEKFGQDALNLPDIDVIIGCLYQCIPTGEVFIIKNLFSILKMYDFFTETSVKYILSTIYRFINTEMQNDIPEEIVEEAILVSKSVCSKDLNIFIGSLISKNLNVNARLCLLISKYTIKHIQPFEELHDAMIKEIVLPAIENKKYNRIALEVLYFYLLHLIDISSDINNYLQLLENHIDNAYDLLVDLVIYSDWKIGTPAIYFKETTPNNLIPNSKLLLYNLGSPFLDIKIANNLFRGILYIYYTTDDDQIKQYCYIFFQEYFSKDESMLVSNFCWVLNELPMNHKIFVDQSFYWLDYQFKQILFYNICVYAVKEFERCKLQLFLGVLQSIEIRDEWEPILLKKILYVLTQLIRKMGGKGNIGDILERLMSIDDGEPISSDILMDVKMELGII